MADKNDDHSKMLSYRLAQAIHNGELERVRMCIEQGTDVNRQCYSDMHEEVYPLELACSRGNEEIMKELLEAGARPNQVSDSRPWQSAMLIAAMNRVLTLSMLRCLISHGANVNFRGIHGQTILHILTRGQFNDANNNLLSAVKLVLDNGASVDARDMCGHTPLYDACRSGNIDLVKLFIAEGADANFNIGHMSMLRGAADGCNIDMFDLLLNASAKRHLTPDALITPCSQNDHAIIARILNICDVDINMALHEEGGMTILHIACRQCNIRSETVRLLLDRGADVRAVSCLGKTALHYAAMECDCNKIRQLLTYNVPLNIKNNENQTPLAKLIHDLSNHYFQFDLQAATRTFEFDEQAYVRNPRLSDALHQAGVLAFKMLVTAGAKVTADDEQNLNQFHIEHPEAQISDYKIHSTRSLKEMCRFVIRGTIPVPVDVNLCKLPIPKLLQEYLNFPEFDPLVDEYSIYLNILIEHDLEYE